MKRAALTPLPTDSEPFRRSRERFIPSVAGCYILTTFEEDILYIGLTGNLRRRINEHLDNPEKTKLTQHGRAVMVYWAVSEEINKIERTWMNIYLLSEGVLPKLNHMYSPTST